MNDNNTPLSEQITCGVYSTRATISTLGTNLGAMTPVFVVLNTVAKEVEKLEQHNAELNDTNTNLLRQNAELGRSNRMHREATQDLHKSNRELGQRVQTLAEANKDLHSRNVALSVRNRELDEQVENLGQRNANLSKFNEAQAQMIQDLTNIRGKLEQHIANTTKEYGDLKLYTVVCQENTNGITPKRLDKITAALDIAQHHVAEHMEPFAEESVAALNVLVKAQKALNKIAAANGIVPVTTPDTQD